ncbi:Glutamate-1-semialdehyde 2,1-aminomutase 1, partial [Geodia barretti]
RLTAFSSRFPSTLSTARAACCGTRTATSASISTTNATSLILGHRDPQVTAALQAQAEKGTAFANPTEPEVELASLLTAALPSLQRLRFTNSGTEGVALALRAARAFTGKSKIAKTEGAYHGTSDHASISGGERGSAPPVPSSQGLTAKTLDDMIIIPFNDAAAARRIIEQHGDDLAAVIVEPVMAGIGYVPAEAAFLEALREACDGQRTLLIFDEVQTLRMAPGGAQQWYDVVPDMSCLGKIIGGGMPVGAFGGRADVMAAFDATEGAPAIPHGGTFNGNPMTMQAGLATMRQLTPEVYERINERGETLRHQLRKWRAAPGCRFASAASRRSSACKLTDRPVTTYRSAQGQDEALRQKLFLHLLNEGIT